MRALTIFTGLIGGLLLSTPATAGSPKPPLYELAKRYESSVENFEKLVLAVRGIDHADEKVVDRLDDAAADVRLAAKNPRHQNRLFHRWQTAKKWHAEVEQRIFGKYTPNHDLMVSWQIVRYHYDLFAEEYFYHVENPQHDRSVRRIPTSNKLRDRYLQSLRSNSRVPTLDTALPTPIFGLGSPVMVTPPAVPPLPRRPSGN